MVGILEPIARFSKHDTQESNRTTGDGKLKTEGSGNYRSDKRFLAQNTKGRVTAYMVMP